MKIVLPSGYKLEAAPPSQNIKASFGCYMVFHLIEGDTLLYVRHMQIDQQLIQPVDYKNYLSFIQAAVKMDNSKFVFKKLR